MIKDGVPKSISVPSHQNGVTKAQMQTSCAPALSDGPILHGNRETSVQKLSSSSGRGTWGARNAVSFLASRLPSPCPLLHHWPLSFQHHPCLCPSP